MNSLLKTTCELFDDDEELLTELEELCDLMKNENLFIRPDILKCKLLIQLQ